MYFEFLVHQKHLQLKHIVLNLYVDCVTRTAVLGFFDPEIFRLDQGHIWHARADSYPTQTCQISAGSVYSVVLERLKSCRNTAVVTKCTCLLIYQMQLSPKLLNIPTSWWTLLSAVTLEWRWRRYAVLLTNINMHSSCFIISVHFAMFLYGWDFPTDIRLLIR